MNSWSGGHCWVIYAYFTRLANVKRRAVEWVPWRWLLWLLIRSRSNIRTFIDYKSISSKCTSHVTLALGPAEALALTLAWCWLLVTGCCCFWCFWCSGPCAMHRRCRITPRLMLLAYKLAHLRFAFTHSVCRSWGGAELSWAIHKIQTRACTR